MHVAYVQNVQADFIAKDKKIFRAIASSLKYLRPVCSSTYVRIIYTEMRRARRLENKQILDKKKGSTEWRGFFLMICGVGVEFAIFSLLTLLLFSTWISNYGAVVNCVGDFYTLGWVHGKRLCCWRTSVCPRICLSRLDKRSLLDVCVYSFSPLANCFSSSFSCQHARMYGFIFWPDISPF